MAENELSELCHNCRPRNRSLHYLTWSEAFSSTRKGYGFIYVEFCSIMTSFYAACLKLFGYDGSHDDMSKLTSSKPIEEEASMAYGMSVISNIFGTLLIYPGRHLTDFRLGMRHTKSFSIGIFLHVVGSLALAPILVPFVYNMIFEDGIPGISDHTMKSVRQAMIAGEYIRCASVCYIALTTLRKEDFFYCFLFHKANTVMVAKRDQTRLMVLLFLACCLGSFLTEPTISIWHMTSFITQPRFFPRLSGPIFALVKHSIISTILLYMLWFKFSMSYMPIILSFISYSIAKNIDRELNNKLTRLLEHDLMTVSKCQSSETLAKLLDTDSNRRCFEVSVFTLCSDWPVIGAEPILSGLSSSQDIKHFTMPGRLRDIDGRCLIFGSRLFCYRKLVRVLSKLKHLVNIFEKNFGIFMIIMVCVNSIIASHWAVLTLIQLRYIFFEVDRIEINRQDIWPILYRFGAGALELILSLASFFLLFDRLPKRLEQLRYKLFSSNLDLLGTEFTWQTELSRFNGWPEVRLAWSLYDHVALLTRQLNLNFIGDLKMGKRCLVSIFSAFVSLIIVYTQLIDVMSRS